MRISTPNYIKEKRKLTIDDKRISIKTIQDLSEIIEREHLIDPTKSVSTYSVEAQDDSAYESYTPQIFYEESIIGRKVLQNISMHFNAFDYSKKIEIQLMHSPLNEEDSNYIIVSGDDSTWVNGIMSQLTEVINLSEDQSVKNIYLWENITGITGIISVVGWLVLSSYLFENIKNKVFQLFIFIAIPSIIGFAFWRIQEEIKNLWPTVEIQTGPSHLQTQVIKRKIITQILYIVVIPLVLTFISDRLITLLR